MKNNSLSYILNLLRKYEFLVIAVLLIVCQIFLTVYLLMPEIRKKNELKSKKESLFRNLSVLRKKTQVLESANIRSMENKLSLILNVMPMNNDYVNLFLRLDDLQNKSGVLINKADIQFGSLASVSASFKSEGRLVAVPLSVDITGDRLQVEDFITMLSDYSGRFISIDDLQWNVSESSNFSSKISANTYYANIMPSSNIEEPRKEIIELVDELVRKVPEKIEAVDTGEDVSKGKSNLFE